MIIAVKLLKSRHHANMCCILMIFNNNWCGMVMVFFEMRGLKNKRTYSEVASKCSRNMFFVISDS